MTLTSVLVGGVAGFFCQVSANAVKKVPLSRCTFPPLSPPTVYCSFIVVIVVPSFVSPPTTNLFYGVADPWMHVLGFMGGCYVGYKLPKIEQQLVEECNAIRKRNGQTPMVGSNSWIRYRLPEEDENAEFGGK
jgi:membrane associated rhomboid family serine protease